MKQRPNSLLGRKLEQRERDAIEAGMRRTGFYFWLDCFSGTCLGGFPNHGAHGNKCDSIAFCHLDQKSAVHYRDARS